MFKRSRSASLFQPRSQERDAENDAAKIDGVLSALRNAIAELRTEKEGLQQRHSQAQERASLMDADNDATAGRLAEMEVAMIYCETRTAKVDDLIDKMQAALAASEASFDRSAERS